MDPGRQKIAASLVTLALAVCLLGCGRSRPPVDRTPETAPSPPASPALTPAPTVPAVNSTPSPAPPPPPTPTPPPTPPPQIVVEDDFLENTNAENYQSMAIAGLKPAPIDLPGGVWQLASGDGSYEAYLTPPASNAAACFHNTASAGLNLASNGSYQKPGVLTISAEIGFAGNSPSGYFLLGFYSGLPGRSASPMQNFTGLALLKDGSLELVENGKASAPVKYTGSHDLTPKLMLSYSIDVAKGSISNISLSGSSTTYAMTSTAFSDAATAFVGIGGATDGQSFCYLDSLKLTAGIVPPPPPPVLEKAEEP